MESLQSPEALAEGVEVVPTRNGRIPGAWYTSSAILLALWVSLVRFARRSIQLAGRFKRSGHVPCC